MGLKSWSKDGSPCGRFGGRAGVAHRLVQTGLHRAVLVPQNVSPVVRDVFKTPSRAHPHSRLRVPQPSECDLNIIGLNAFG